MEGFERNYVNDMFNIITNHLSWDQLGLDSYYELENIKEKMAYGTEMSRDEMQKLYNIIQSTRYFFNAHVDDPCYPDSFKIDAIRFGVYYNLFLSVFPVKGLKNPKNEHGACYIATAVYGSYYNPNVIILRCFRDEYLSKNKIGRKFIDVYYHISPRLVNRFGSSRCFKFISRGLLNIIVLLIEKLKKNGIPT